MSVIDADSRVSPVSALNAKPSTAMCCEKEQSLLRQRCAPCNGGGAVATATHLPSDGVEKVVYYSL